MVQKVDTPPEHYLINNAPYLVAHFMRNTLMKFSINRLLETGLASRTLKTGLDFTDAYKAPVARSKFNLYIWQKILKDLSYVSDEFISANPVGPNMGFLVRANGSPVLTILTIYDLSIARYVRLLQRWANQKDLLLEITIRRDRLRDKMDISISSGRIRNPTDYFRIYKGLFYIEDYLKVIRTLSRKARFMDNNVKAYTRSRYSGFGSGESTLDNGNTPNIPGNPVTPAPDTARY